MSEYWYSDTVSALQIGSDIVGSISLPCHVVELVHPYPMAWPMLLPAACCLCCCLCAAHRIKINWAAYPCHAMWWN